MAHDDSIIKHKKTSACFHVKRCQIFTSCTKCDLWIPLFVQKHALTYIQRYKKRKTCKNCKNEQIGSFKPVLNSLIST